MFQTINPTNLRLKGEKRITSSSLPNYYIISCPPCQYLKTLFFKGFLIEIRSIFQLRTVNITGITGRDSSVVRITPAEASSS